MPKIRRYIKEGRSLNSMEKEFEVRWTTMRNFCKVNIFVKPLPPLMEEPKKHGHPTYRELQWFKKNGDL